jgi:hypothetical protein
MADHHDVSRDSSSRALHTINAVVSAMTYLHSDEGYELLANGERWRYIVDALMQAGGVAPKERAALMQSIEGLS